MKPPIEAVQAVDELFFLHKMLQESIDSKKAAIRRDMDECLDRLNAARTSSLTSSGL